MKDIFIGLLTIPAMFIGGILFFFIALTVGCLLSGSLFKIISWIEKIFVGQNTENDSGQNIENHQVTEIKEEKTFPETVILSGRKKKKKSLKERLIQQIENQDRVGRLYEQKIGAIYEGRNYEVEYTGIEKGKEDGGVDLIAKKDDEILLIQCKAWAAYKVIHEKYIYYLQGVVEDYKAPDGFKCRGIFFCSCSLSDNARTAAKKRNIEVYENFSIN